VFGDTSEFHGTQGNIAAIDDTNRTIPERQTHVVLFNILQQQASLLVAFEVATFLWQQLATLQEVTQPRGLFPWHR